MADLGPVAVGFIRIETVQLLKAARLAPQAVLFKKSPGFVPPKAMLLMVKAELRLLARVRFCAGLVLPTATVPKLRLAGVSVAAAADVP